jgi:multicomponent Na+:H+ antiporter subunit B
LKALVWLTMAIFATLLILATGALPDHGAPDSPSQTYLAPEYIRRAQQDTGSPNIVTAVLADYRSYDTLGETAVIFTAGLGVVLVLMRGEKRDQ